MDVLILGIGNTLLRDEGLGVHVVNRLADEWDVPDGVEVLDGGTAGMDLLDRVARARALAVVDCGRLDAPPGTVRLIEGEAVPAFFATRISPHQIGLSDLMGAVMLLGCMPERLALIAVQPESMELGLEMTATGEAAAKAALAQLVTLMADWGVAPVRKLPAVA